MHRHYKLRPSRFLNLLIGFLGVSALSVLWMLPLPAFVPLVLTVFLSGWTVYCMLRDAGLRLGHSCVAFRLEDQDEIVLVLRNGSHLAGRVLPDSWVTPHAVILNVLLDERHGRRSVLILPDAMSAESFRRLRVVLGWGERAGREALL
jgi:toxin CptA